MKTVISAADEEAVSLAGQILRRGGLVAIPTETVYGLAANALDEEAVRSIYRAKGRPSDNPLIVHISRLSQWGELVEELPERALALAEAFWPGPLTIILKKSPIVPAATSGGLDTVAVRMPSNPVSRSIIESAGVPLAAPSANTSGRPSPTNAGHVIEDLNGKIDMIIDGGECRVGVESTVITLASEVPTVLRPGGITPEMLEEVLGEIRVDDSVFSPLSEGEAAPSPGMKYKHYSPKAEIIIVEGGFERFESVILEHETENPVALCFDEDVGRLGGFECVSLGSENDPSAQAARLFSALRELDERGAGTVYARLPEKSGIGLAVFNRLIRSAGFRVI